MPRVGRALRRLIARLRRLRGYARPGEEERMRTMLTGMTVEKFTEALAAATPTPGGGSASAQAGAMAASLLRVMCDLTLGRANLFAIESPMAIADACAALMTLAGELAHKGNVNAVSDVGAAALLAYAGLRGAVLSVRVNLKGVKDEAHAAKVRERVRRLEVDSEKLRDEALTAVYVRTNGR